MRPLIQKRGKIRLRNLTLVKIIQNFMSIIKSLSRFHLEQGQLFHTGTADTDCVGSELNHYKIYYC